MGILTVASKPQEVTLSSTVSTTVTYNYVELRIYLCFGIVLTSRYKRPHTVPFMFVNRIPYPHRYKQKKTLSSKQDKRQLVHHVIVAPLYIQKLFSHSARIIYLLHSTSWDIWYRVHGVIPRFAWQWQAWNYSRHAPKSRWEHVLASRPRRHTSKGTL